MRKQAQNARSYPKDDPRLEMVYVSSPVGSLRHRRSSGAGGAAFASPAAQSSCTQIRSSLPCQNKKETAAWDSSSRNFVRKLE